MPTIPQDQTFSDQIKDLGARLSRLEAGVPLANASCRAAASQWLDASGGQQVLVGLGADGTYGLWLGGQKLGMGSGVPRGGGSGDFYLRTDTPGTANQRLYVNSAGAWTGIL